MNRRTGEIQVFSVSFLDVLSCALGGVLLLLLQTMDTSEANARRFQSALASRERQIDEAFQELRAVGDALEESQKDAEKLANSLKGAADALASARNNANKLANANNRLRRAQAALIGLKGDMSAVVFAFDTSGSMGTLGPGKFDEYTGLLKTWIRELQFESFNVIEFDDDVVTWDRTGLVAASKSNREAATRFVNGFVPDGNTSTKAALEEALEQLNGQGTIVLFSDGRPSDDSPNSIRSWLLSNNPNVTINTVAMGAYLRQEYGEFLQAVAAENRGMFIGR